MPSLAAIYSMQKACVVLYIVCPAPQCGRCGGILCHLTRLADPAPGPLTLAMIVIAVPRLFRILSDGPRRRPSRWPVAQRLLHALVVRVLTMNKSPSRYRLCPQPRPQAWGRGQGFGGLGRAQSARPKPHRRASPSRRSGKGAGGMGLIPVQNAARWLAPRMELHPCSE